MKLSLVISEMRSRGWQVFDRPGEFNIVGVRSDSTKPNTFNDEIHVFYKENGRWVHHAFTATTDPGTYWLHNPAVSQGTALLAEQQALGAYAIALHRGKYRALCQRLKPVSVIRDYNRDSVLDFSAYRAHRGFFGINIHRASANGTTKTVDRHSAGCQVFAKASDFTRFMGLCEAHRTRWGNVFTYSLIDRRSLMRRRRKRILKWGGIALLSAFSIHQTKHLWQNK